MFFSITGISVGVLTELRQPATPLIERLYTWKELVNFSKNNSAWLEELFMMPRFVIPPENVPDKHPCGRNSSQSRMKQRAETRSFDSVSGSRANHSLH